jgi:DNA polymerase elongation subunit (family B)
VKQVKRLINKRNRELKQGLVYLSELKAKTILRRKPSRYKTRLPHVTGAKALDINRKEVDQGGLISYIYVDSKHSNPFGRVSPAGYQEKFDYIKY